MANKQTVVISADDFYFIEFDKEDNTVWSSNIRNAKRLIVPSRELSGLISALILGDSQGKIEIECIK